MAIEPHVLSVSTAVSSRARELRSYGKWLEDASIGGQTEAVARDVAPVLLAAADVIDAALGAALAKHREPAARREVKLVGVADIPTQDMRYDLRALGIDVGKLTDVEVRREFEDRFGSIFPKNPNIPHPDR
jgi:hypothetical protein